MAKITLNNLSHSYVSDYTDEDFVLRDINIDWKDGGASVSYTHLTLPTKA